MALRLIIRHENGQTEIFIRHPDTDDDDPFGDPRPFAPPLPPEDLAELRFYLEEYTLPVGEYLVRGERVEKEKLATWGEALYAAAFGNDEKRRDAYIVARGAVSHAEPVEVVIRSSDPRVLGLPWELLKAPDDGAPLSTQVERFDRSLLKQEPPRQFADISDGFRVLMVIARPEGGDDVSFQAVARPLFEHLEHHDGPVSIEVLRPPTFEAFGKQLTAAKNDGRPYHAVHFDGHGVFGAVNSANGSANSNMFAGEAPQGFVLFEQDAGGGDLVSAQDFADALKAGGVPLVILNACQSAAMDGAQASAGPEASIATRLLQEGAASVVAMSHSVYVVAAAAFMAAFYEALFAGKCVGEAVNTGRKALRVERNSWRPSLKGEMKLQDWMVPVHYARSTLRLPVAVKPKASPMDIAAQVFASAAARNGEAGGDPLAAAEKFCGRDAEFFALERAIRTTRVALIHGVGGVGKTELAKAFARWLLISRGLDDPRLVFVHEFLPGRPTFGLDAILGEIMARFGQAELYLQAPDTATRAQLVLQVLAQVRGLLVWDNFETAASMPEPGQATPPLDEAKRAELLAFMGAIRNTRSALLITSRSDEPWLGGPDALVRCEVRGLGKHDALAYAGQVLAPHAAAIQRREADPKGFKLLLDTCQGHPLSLKLVLPHLTRETAEALLAALKGSRDLPESGHGGRRAELASLTASIEYSFRHLPEADQQRAVILPLFEKVVSVNIPGTMKEPPSRFAGLDPHGWDALLAKLAGLGLLTGLGGGLYALHPALPPFLAARWRTQAGDAFAAEREQALASLIRAAAEFAAYLFQLIGSGNAEAAFQQIALQRSSLGAFLGAALARQRFPEAQAIIQALNEYWNAAGLTAEAQEWTDRVLAATEAAAGGVPEMETTAHSLWLFVKGTEARRAKGAHRLDKAEAIYRQIAVSFEGRDTDNARRSLAVAYHQLGMVAQDRGQWAEAEGWYKKSLAIREALNNQPGMAGSYHQLGMVAQDRGQLAEAEGWYKKSLAIREALNNQPGMASSYHQLGIVAEDRGQWAEAEGWYKKSLAISEALHDQPGMASSYHQLGILAQARGQWAEAEGWYKKSLAIREALNNQPGMANSYGQLGNLARAHGRLEEAEGWYKKSLAITEALNNQPGMAKTLANLGNLCADQGDEAAALRFAIRACAMFGEFPNPHSSAPWSLARYWSQLGREPVASAWRDVTGQDMPAGMPGVLDALAAEIAKRQAGGGDG